MAMKNMRGALATGALLGVMLLVQSATAQAPVAGHAPRVIGDIALSQGGVLQGQMLDRQGQPVKQSVVKVVQNERVIAQGTTDEQGNFSVAGLRTGVYNIQAGEHSSVHRVWAANQAPPAANTGVLIVDGQAARGQVAGLGALGTAAVGAGAVGGYLLLDEYVFDDDPPAS